jgi:hypothetical protein
MIRLFRSPRNAAFGLIACVSGDLELKWSQSDRSAHLILMMISAKSVQKIGKNIIT